jgi:TonB family protein
VRLAFVLVLVACSARPGPHVPAQQHRAPRLQAPQLIDTEARGSAYLTAVALSLQPAWHQFLEDCRLRLPADHPLNRMSLHATAQLEIQARGHVVSVRLASSGNADFDAAVKQVVDDASPLPPPPRELWSDDDHVHLTWLFARDRRQAGPATAQVIDVELPLLDTVDRRIREHDLTHAARRILRERPSADRETATQRLMIAVLDEALGSSDMAVRREAVQAVGRASVQELAVKVRPHVRGTSDADLRIALIEAAAALHDDAAVSELLDRLRIDIREQPKLALATVRALLALDRGADVGQLLHAELGTGTPNLIAVQALAIVPRTELTSALATWFRTGDARTRAAVCVALASYSLSASRKLIERGLTDRDASVRAACIAAAAAPRPAGKPMKLSPELARDRDSLVRAAYASALATAPRPAELRGLIADPDPDVRAAAWTTLAALADAPADRAELAARAAQDPAAQVQLAAIPAIDDDAVLEHLTSNDDAREVRSAALVRLTVRRGRAAMADRLVERIAEAAPGTSERVRTALAWYLAR